MLTRCLVDCSYGYKPTDRGTTKNWLLCQGNSLTWREGGSHMCEFTVVRVTLRALPNRNGCLLPEEDPISKLSLRILSSVYDA